MGRHADAETADPELRAWWLVAFHLQEARSIRPRLDELAESAAVERCLYGASDDAYEAWVSAEADLLTCDLMIEHAPSVAEEIRRRNEVLLGRMQTSILEADTFDEQLQARMRSRACRILGVQRLDGRLRRALASARRRYWLQREASRGLGLRLP